ncbi:MAG: hypothetical protein HYX53_05360 [Chloroflexi bacterium]|nr:hypothetical protein [Chloroflexota bacterium]
MRKFRRLSLSTRLTLLAVATLCPVVALTVVAYVHDRNSRRADAIKETGASSQATGAGLENFATDLETLTLAAAIALGRQEEPISNERDQSYLAARRRVRCAIVPAIRRVAVVTEG